MTKKYLSPMVFIGAALAMIFGACGTSDPSAPALTKEQFIQRATKICYATEGEELKLLASFRSSHPTADEEETLGPVAVPALETQVDRLSALSPPEGDESVIQAFIGQLKEDLEEAKKDPEGINRAVFAKSNRLAQKYGINACSHVP